MKIAVVGSGIAGLTVAHHLHPEHDITVFEANEHVGGHVDTHNVSIDGHDYCIDSGFIVFNHRTYPNFTRMLDELGVKSKESNMSFSVSCGMSGLEYNGSNLNTLFAQRKNLLQPRFWGMLSDIYRFNREATALLQNTSDETGLGDFLTTGGYGHLFRNYYILPMGAAIWSTEPSRMLSFPARFFVRFFHNHGLLSLRDRPLWRVIRDGSRSYVDRLVAPFRDKIRLHCPVKHVIRHDHYVTVRTTGGAERFDAVFLACHSDQSLAILADPSPAEREVLSAIPYQPNEATLHTDTRLLPKRRQTWAAWNYLMPEGPEGKRSLTYNMNILQGFNAQHTFCVSINAEERIDADKIISKMTYHHPIFTPAGTAAQARHREINGTRRTYYCGAWWRNGFHEDGLVSALDALRHFRQDFYTSVSTG